MAIGAWLVTLCDVGGAYATRARAMLTMTVGGVLVCLLAGAVSSHFALAVLVMLVLGTGLSLLRVLGDVGAKVGSLLVVLLALTLGARSQDFHAVVVQALLFGAGGLASTTLALLFWRVHPYKPARLAVARSLHALADVLDELRLLIRPGAEKEPWDAWIRSSPRRVRAAIEAAREALLATRRGRIAGSTTGDRLQIIVEEVDGIFEAAIALGDQLEHCATRPGELSAEEVERSLAAIVAELRRLAEATIDPRLHAAATRIDPAGARLGADVPSRGAILRSIATIVQSLEVTAAAVALLPGAAVASLPRDADREDAVDVARRTLAMLRAHLTPGSHAFRHAARVGITTAAALLLTALLPLRHGLWVVLAAAVSLQPSYSATWFRAVQRLAGTAAGAALVALLAGVAPHPALMIALIATTTFAAIALMPLNYFYYAFFLTPAFVLFAEIAEGRQDLASARVLDTLVGGVLAVVGASLFWRRADDQLLLRELAVAVERERVFVGCALARLAGDSEGSGAELAEARRQVGLANNNAEDTLQQLLAAGSTPRHEALAVVLTYVRRITATIVNVLAAREAPNGPALEAFARRIDASLAALRASLEEAADNLPRGKSARGGEETRDDEPVVVTAEGLPEPLRRVEIFVGEMRRRLIRS
jgi:uncharacterized membrane protein YccC